MSKEQALYKKSIFEYASPEKQKNICLDFINSISKIVIDTDSLDYLKEVKNEVVNQSNNSEFAIRTAIHCLDLFLIDEIRTYIPNSQQQIADGASVYFRSDVYKQRYPDEILSKLTNGNSSSEIVISTPSHVGRFSRNFKMLTPDLAYIVLGDKDLLNKPDPPCGISRQELYKSLLRCGINPLDGMKINRQNDSRKKQIPDQRYLRMFDRKGKLLIDANSIVLESWNEKTRCHWGSILKEVSDTSRQSVLFSSGTSAAEAAILAIAKRCKGKSYIHPYWYYENIPTANESLNISNLINIDTQIALINLEPTNFFTFDKNIEIRTPIDIIKNMAELCILDDKSQRYVVVDVTVDPLFKISDILKIIPKNLHVIKTLSITKHQRGGRKYFFGAVYTNDQQIQKQILSLRPKVGGDISESQVAHFPRITKGWLIYQKTTVSTINKNLSTINTSGDLRNWTIAPYTYHSFILPPDDILDKIIDVSKKGGDLNATVNEINNRITQDIDDVVKQMNTQWIEIGDSFGLPQTRVSSQGGFNELNGSKFRLKLPRICPGYNTPPSKVQELTVNLVKKLSSIDVVV